MISGVPFVMLMLKKLSGHVNFREVENASWCLRFWRLEPYSKRAMWSIRSCIIAVRSAKVGVNALACIQS